jgi:surface antigen
VVTAKKMSTTLNQTLCDLDAIPSILESIRLRCQSGQWFLKAEEWASNATNALEKLSVHFENEDESEGDAYTQPKELHCLKSLDRHLELLMGTKDLQVLFKEKLADLEMVELLLPFVDPSTLNNYAIRIASLNGHLEVVVRLLQDGRVDPSALNNDAFGCASEKGHLAVVDRLLQDGRVDPSADNNYAIRWASRNGHIAVVNRLLQDERVDPSADNNYAIRWASLKGDLAVIERLLGDERVDPSADNNYAIRWASQKGHVAVVDRLRQDPRVDPSA